MMKSEQLAKDDGACPEKKDWKPLKVENGVE
jgi:hypothetical protein